MKSKQVHTLDIEFIPKNKKHKSSVLRWDFQRKYWWLPVDMRGIMMASMDGVSLLMNKESSQAWGPEEWVLEELSTPEQRIKMKRVLKEMFEKHVKNYKNDEEILALEEKTE